MKNQPCVEFLQWCLPQLGYQWKGFRKVRKQVCKRIKHRFSDLHLSTYPEYRDYLAFHETEWNVLDALCYVTVSRFYRDRKVFDILQSEILPMLADSAIKTGTGVLRCWSAGCCAGEEPYTLKMLWEECLAAEYESRIALQIIATDRNTALLERAKHGVYPEGSLKELAGDVISKAFIKKDKSYVLKKQFKTGITFAAQDIRKDLPDGKFDLVLCRNLVFTYFKDDLQGEMVSRIVRKLKPEGLLVIGAHESLPAEQAILFPYRAYPCIFQQ